MFSNVAGFGLSMRVNGMHRNISKGEMRERGVELPDCMGLRASSKLHS
jgi:hypothetical protein